MPVATNYDAFAQIPFGKSLAEAILSGDIILALNLAYNRPMLSLADATADIDTVYRMKKDSAYEISISDNLKRLADNFTEEQLAVVIKSMTSAIDGTYTNELEAVKTAIMKTISVVNSWK